MAFYVPNKKYLRSFAVLKVKKKRDITIFHVTLDLYIFNSCSKHVEFFTHILPGAITLRFQ